MSSNGASNNFNIQTSDWEKLKQQISGDLYHSHKVRTLYATDASSYRMLPSAVALPKSHEDIKKLVDFSIEKNIPLTPRAAGTSLSGQPIGRGIVVDVGRYLNQVLEVNKDEKWARIHPGVIRNELNEHLEPYDLFFGPETSTQNRAMIGGMMGNNSCGANSVVYRDSRTHLLEVKGFLADGSEVVFGELTKGEFEAKCSGDESLLETKLYQQIRDILSDDANQKEIQENFPDQKIFRRNTGYALDVLSRMEPFKEGGEPFNFCKLIAGSAGTLVFISELKVNLVDHPPAHRTLSCINFKTLDSALRANIAICQHTIMSCELIDDYTIECARENPLLNEELFFLKDKPGAVLIVEVAGDTQEESKQKIEKIINDVKEAGYGYHFPIITGEDVDHVWHLRNAALGVASNVEGDEKPATNIDDCAVSIDDLPDFIQDVDDLLKRNNLPVMYYAHASAGELHITPYFNTKTKEGIKLFRDITLETAKIVKKYKGFLSGEHGTGWLRGEFTEFMLGEKIYGLMKEIKATWDPQGIFNPTKIVDAPRNNINLRYDEGYKEPSFDTVFDWGTEGFVRHAERCNGTAECRKTEHAGGTMCPSYMATRDERHVTRARANMLREIFTRSSEVDPFQSEEIHEVLDLCLSCKGCKSECPSDVDIAKLKAEFLQHYYDKHGVPMRSRMIANFNMFAKYNSIFPQAYNFMFTNSITAPIIKKLTGFAQGRSVPPLSLQTVRNWYKKNKSSFTSGDKGKVYVFCDEFTNYLDAEIGITMIKLLDKLGYYPQVIEHDESGRAHISKGLIREAKVIANNNLRIFKDLISEDTPLVGIEPSAVLSFRDEYPDLADPDVKEAAKDIAKHTYIFDEFISNEIDKGNITSDMFNDQERQLIFHGHCQQKALTTLDHSKKMLSIPENYSVDMIPSGCCGMAGSFGYESEHFDVSMKVGELVLLPTVRKHGEEVIVVAPGTSCRHQIKDGTHRHALHPAQVLWDALK
ncbi:MAG: FAD-linked oxidase C-terminal domain-containing protein [Thermodesulfobacteriota bacterium]